MKDISKILGYQPTLYIGDGHGIETAGKRTPNIPGIGVIKENQFNKPTANFLEIAAKEVGFRVVQIAPEDNEPSLSVRSGRVNADFKKQRAANPGVPASMLAVGISIHFNAYNGVFDGKKGGVEVFYHATSVNGKKLASLLLENLLHGYSQVSRGIKNNNLHMTRETDPVFCLVECGFMDQIEEAKKMIDPGFQLEEAEELLRGVCQYYGQDLDDLRQGSDVATPILGDATATVEQAQAWARSKGATQTFIDVAPIVWEIAQAAGVNPVGTYVQSAKETGFMKFGGVIDATYFNPCGMKVTAGGGNYDPNAHKRFKDWYEGYAAMVDHEALYAGAPGYPKKNTPDPRHFAFIAGVAPNWEDLGGRWAPSKTYGESIVSMMKQLEATVVEVKPAKPNQEVVKYEAEISQLRSSLEAMTSRTVDAEAKLKKIKTIVGGTE